MLLSLMVTSTLVPVSLISSFSVNNVEAALALSFTTNKYRTGNTETTFAAAFTGTSPKLTYATTSASTMTNSTGSIVWAPHNLVPNSEDFRASGPSSAWVHQNNATITQNAIAAPDGSSRGTQLGFTAANNSQIRNDFGLGSASQGTHTLKVWVRCATGTTEKVRLKTFGAANGSQNSADITVTDQWVQVSHSFLKSTGSSMSTYISNATDAVARTIYIWGAHVYRSDLGGMAQVPGAVGDFQYYVPTNGNSEYLPRVGHHVYNGSTWVNEGLLIESEPRTNLVRYSEDFSQWTASSGATVTAGTASPTGQADAYQITLAGNNDNVQLTTAGLSTSAAVQYSVYLRVSSGTQSVNLGNIDAGQYQSVTVTTEWQRFVITQTPSATTRFARILNATNNSFTVEAFGAQLEQSSTPSSYIPTSGSTVTRAAQSLSVPPAEFGWNSSDVSIQMDGRMTFADQDQPMQHVFWQWKKDNLDQIRINLDTHSSYGTGRISFQQIESNTYDLVNSSANILSPGNFVPFSIASRHGTSFVNGAVDGTALTANTTPAALPDLSSANLQIAYDYMGTIGTFRQFTGDIGDTGLEEATS